VVVDCGKEILTIETDADTLVIGTLVKGNSVTKTGVAARRATTQRPTRTGVPLLCHMSRSDQLKLADFLHSVGVTSVRAGCRQVIEVFGDYSRELL
jgi:hypothetical protein